MRIAAFAAIAALTSAIAACGSYPTECDKLICGKISAICSTGKEPVIALQVGTNGEGSKKNNMIVDYTYIVTSSEGVLVAQDTRRVEGKRLDEVEIPFSADKVTVALTTDMGDLFSSKLTNTCGSW